MVTSARISYWTFRFVLVLLAFVAGGSSSVLAATAWWCLKDSRIREIAVVPTETGGCAVDYRKPVENIYQEALWRSSYNLNYCGENAAGLKKKLVQGAWTCGPEFFVPDERADRSRLMKAVLEYVVDFRATANERPYLQELIGPDAQSLSVALYNGPVVRYGPDLNESGSDDGNSGSMSAGQRPFRKSMIYLLAFEAGCLDSLEQVSTRCRYFAVVPNFSIGGWAGSLADDEGAFREILSGAVICPAEDAQTILVEDDIFLYGSESGLDRRLDRLDEEGLWISDAGAQTPVANVVVHQTGHRYVLRCRAHGE